MALKGLTSMQRKTNYFKRPIIVVCSNASEHRGGQMDCQYAEKESDEISKMDWREVSTRPKEFPAYCDKYVDTLTQNKSIWDVNPGPTKGVQQWIELQSSIAGKCTQLRTE